MAMQEAKQKPSRNFNCFSSKNISSSACVVECYVCGKRLTDGCSITAKTLPIGIVMFCDVHYLVP